MSNSVRLVKPLRTVRPSEQTCVTFAFPSWETQKSGRNILPKDQKAQLNQTTKEEKNENFAVVSHNAESVYAKGFEDGRMAAIEAMQKEFEVKLHDEQRVTIIKTIGQLETLIANIQKEFLHLQAKSEEVVLKFALAVAEQILKREVKLDNTIVLQHIRESLRRVLGVENIKVRVHPDDEAIVRENKPAILTSSDSLREIVIESDEKVERGGCILESDSGNVDARISTQMKKIEAALIDDGVLMTP